MPNTNFTVAVPAALIAEFKDKVAEAAKANDVLLMDAQANGCKQVWALRGYDKPVPVVTGYESGKVTFQNLNPTRIGLEVKIITRWSNTPKGK